MTMRLQTTEGEIKEYGTAQVLFISGVEGSPVDKYVTKCGREWEPATINHECGHLDCAIYLVKQQKKGRATGVYIFDYARRRRYNSCICNQIRPKQPLTASAHCHSNNRGIKNGGAATTAEGEIKVMKLVHEFIAKSIQL